MENESLTVATLPEAPVKKRMGRPRKDGLPPIQAHERPKKLIHKHKRFAENVIKTGGNQALAYRMTYGITKNPQVSASILMRKPEIRTEVERLLDKSGMPKTFFVGKLRELADAKTHIKGVGEVPDNSTQFNVMKMGLELHGLIAKRPDVGVNVENINYSLDADKLGEVLNKLSEVTRKLDFSGYPKVQAEDAIVIERDTIIEENQDSEEDSTPTP